MDPGMGGRRAEQQLAVALPAPQLQDERVALRLLDFIDAAVLQNALQLLGYLAIL